MIVGPYKEPFLQAAFASTIHLCDQWVFIDTAPGNNPNRGTLNDIAYHYQFDDTPGRVKIIDMPRGEDKDFSYSEARELARKNSDSEWILRLDADEVIHENDIDRLRTLTEEEKYNAIEVSFYHFMVYPWLYQYVEPKSILLRTNSFSWVKGVHEVPITSGHTFKAHDIKYFHYGYCRGQEEVFKRWQLYIEIDGRFVVKSVGPQVASVRGISGATILGDGRIVIILDMGALVRSEWRARSADASVRSTRDERIFALVVDDSITVRRVTQRLLERNAMRVLTAKDGVDAMALLQEHGPDVILLDIEMPRMDGYEEPAHVRNDPRLVDVPIIMITSRVGEKHRARAIEIGVDDYLGKPYQESQLLDAVEALVLARRAQPL